MSKFPFNSSEEALVDAEVKDKDARDCFDEAAEAESSGDTERASELEIIAGAIDNESKRSLFYAEELENEGK